MALENVVVGNDQAGTTLPGTLHNVVGDSVSSQIFPVGKIILGAIGANDGPVASGNPMPVSGAVTVSSSALPTGASTAARQDTGNTSLSSIDGKITACNTGAVTIGAALPVGDNAVGRVKLTDGTDVADILDLSNSNPLTVAVVDGSGSQRDGRASKFNN